MTKEYYIRITDTKPSDIEDGVYFKYHGTGEDEEFYLLTQNEYVQLKNDFDGFKNDFQTTIDPYVVDALSRFPVAKSTQSYEIIDETNSSKKLTYNDIINALSGKVGTNIKLNDETVTTEIIDLLGKLKILNNTAFPTVSSDVTTLKNKVEKLEHGYQWILVDWELTGNWDIWYNDYCVFIKSTNLSFSRYEYTGNFMELYDYDNNPELIIPDRYQDKQGNSINLRPNSMHICKTHIDSIDFELTSNGKLYYRIKEEIEKKTQNMNNIVSFFYPRRGSAHFPSSLSDNPEWAK